MNDVALQKTQATATPETIGQASARIPVELSTRFLEHFSEQLYSSPQKAFEELISNGWDAGADCVDVRIAPDLKSPAATMSVLDNGHSMDEDGLRQLWHIAFSPKKDKPVQNGRQVIGKFGIGKLATYVLATKLTYICKAADGKIRRVTMDYGEIDRQKGASQDKLISELSLDLFEATEAEVTEALASVHHGNLLLDLISTGMPLPQGRISDDEFGAPKSGLQHPTSGTWTLVVLSGLKPAGRELKLGVLRRMLEAALPFGSEMAISINGELLASSKINAPLMREWVIGPDLSIDYVEIDDTDIDEERGTAPPPGAVAGVAEAKGQKVLTRIPVKSVQAPFPHIEMAGVGAVTGRVWLFESKISGGKKRGARSVEWLPRECPRAGGQPERPKFR